MRRAEPNDCVDRVMAARDAEFPVWFEQQMRPVPSRPAKMRRRVTFAVDCVCGEDESSVPRVVALLRQHASDIEAMDAAGGLEKQGTCAVPGYGIVSWFADEAREIEGPPEPPPVAMVEWSEVQAPESWDVYSRSAPAFASDDDMESVSRIFGAVQMLIAFVFMIMGMLGGVGWLFAAGLLVYGLTLVAWRHDAAEYDAWLEECRKPFAG